MKHFENISESELFKIMTDIKAHRYGLVQIFEQAEKYIKEHTDIEKHEIFSAFLTLYLLHLETEKLIPTFSNPFDNEQQLSQPNH